MANQRADIAAGDAYQYRPRCDNPYQDEGEGRVQAKTSNHANDRQYDQQIPRKLLRQIRKGGALLHLPRERDEEEARCSAKQVSRS